MSIKEKILKFLENEKVKAVEFAVLVITAAGLLIGGQSVEGINSVISTVGGLVTGIGALITLITNLIKKK